MLPVLPSARGVAISCSERRDLTIEVCYRPGADGPLGRGSGFWYGRCRLLKLLGASASCLSLVGLCICWRVGGTRDIPVEALLPEGRERFELGSSGWSRVLGIDAVGGAPHCDFADEGGARVTSRCSPDWRAVTLAGVIVDLVGEVGDQVGSLCQVGAPDGMVMERCWNAGKPGQRTWVGRREALGGASRGRRPCRRQCRRSRPAAAVCRCGRGAARFRPLA